MEHEDIIFHLNKFIIKIINNILIWYLYKGVHEETYFKEHWIFFSNSLISEEYWIQRALKDIQTLEPLCI